MPTEKLYDLTLINQVAKGNIALQEKLCRTFIISATEGLEELQTASANGSIEHIHKASHKLKSTIEAMNVREATILIKLIEKSARLQVNTEEIPEMIQQAASIIRETITQLKNDMSL